MAGPNESTSTLDVAEQVPNIPNSFLDQLAAEAEASVRRGPDLTEAQNPNAQVTQEPIDSSQPSQLPPEALPPSPVGIPQSTPTPPPAEAQAAPSAAQPPPVEASTVPAVEPEPPAAPAPAHEQTPAERLAYKLAREAEKREKEIREELQRERYRLQQIEIERAAERAVQQRQQTPAIESPEVYEQDPLTQLQQQQAQYQQQLAQLQQQLQVQQLETEITTQVNQFTQQHPDFDDALKHYVETEIQVAEEDGTIDDTISRIRGLGPQGNEMIRTVAMQNSMTENEAARQLAIATIYQQRRQQLAVAAKRSGKNMGELVYARAQRYGYRPSEQAPAPLPQEASATEHIRQEQTAAATSSLANIPRQGATPRPREYTRADLEALMKSDPNAANAYFVEMDNKDPKWLEKLV